MDLISHGTWGAVIARRKSLALGFLIGTLPDILGLGWWFGPKPYLIAHSLIAFVIVAGATRIAYHTWVYSFSYLAHLLSDVIAHGRGTYSLFYVPFLWRSYDPIRFHGWNWWHEGMILEVINWCVLIVVIIILIYKKR